MSLTIVLLLVVLTVFIIAWYATEQENRELRLANIVLNRGNHDWANCCLRLEQEVRRAQREGGITSLEGHVLGKIMSDSRAVGMDQAFQECLWQILQGRLRHLPAEVTLRTIETLSHRMIDRHQVNHELDDLNINVSRDPRHAKK